MRPRSTRHRSDSGGEVVRFYEFDESFVASAAFDPDEQRVLEVVTRKLGARESLRDLLDFLAEALRPISPCDRFSLAFVEDEGHRVRAYYTRAFYEPLHLKNGYAEHVGASTLATVLQRGVPRVIHDLEAYYRLHPHSRSTPLLLREGVRSSLTCPLRVDDRTVGLLFRSGRRPRAYDERHVVFQVALTERLSQAVEKAWRIEQLAEANRAYTEMLAFVTHELRAPLASLLTDANLLVDGYLGEMPPQQHERVLKIIGKGRHLMTLIHDYLELARLEGGQLRCEPRVGVDLVGDVLRPTVDIMAAQADLKRMKINFDLPPSLAPVELDPKLCKLVVVNLLSNAIKYGADGGEIRVIARQYDDRLSVAVWNQGIGFKPEERVRLFRRFSRLSSTERSRQIGTGIGLYTSWRIVQLHGGRMDARSEPGYWAEFSFEIPQPLSGALPPLEHA